MIDVLEDELDLTLKDKIQRSKKRFRDAVGEPPDFLFVSNIVFAKLYNMASQKYPLKLYGMSIHVVPTLEDHQFSCA